MTDVGGDYESAEHGAIDFYLWIYGYMVTENMEWR